MNSQEIKTIFNRIAPVYDQLNNSLSFGLHRIWKEMTVKWCQPNPEDRGLDLCCGSGDLAFLLAKRLNNGHVIGVDFSPELLTIAKQRTAQLPRSLPLTWQEADVLNLPFDDNSFDCATMGYGLRNVTDIPRCLSEIHRVLKMGAKAAILDFNRPSLSYVRNFQQWYLDNLVVATAQNLGLTAEYAYISPSLDRFPSGREQVQLSYVAGFNRATHYPIAGGLMGVLVVTK